MISTAVLIGAIIGAVVGAGVGFGIAAYNDYKDDGQIFNGSVAWYDYLGATLLGGTIGAVVGGAIGYGIGYLAGGTYSNGLVAKSVTKGVKSFMSNTNNINLVYATIVGSNIGALFTPIGALAGIMWIRMLKENNVKYKIIRKK